jgi:hypothetical protein
MNPQTIDLDHRGRLFNPLEKHTFRLFDRLQFGVWREAQPFPKIFWDHNAPCFFPEGQCDRSLARSAWDIATPKEDIP